MIDYLLLLAGLAVLLIGGDVLIRGAVSLAERLSIPPLIIGLTIVSLGTSAPELVVSIDAAIQGSGGLAIGNVVGSNIANVLVVLGVPALIRSTPCSDAGIGRNMLVMTGFTLLFMLMLARGQIGFVEGCILITLLCLFLYSQYRTARLSSVNNLPDYHEEVHDIPKGSWLPVLYVVVGLLLLPLGAELIVNSAQVIAKNWGVSEEVIGVSVLALGTSLPELAASVMAILRGSGSVAIGNVVGSNIFNIAAIMGFTTVITPITVGGHIVTLDMWVMLASALLLAFMAHYLKSISILGGLAMITGYIIFIVVSFIT